MSESSLSSLRGARFRGGRALNFRTTGAEPSPLDMGAPPAADPNMSSAGRGGGLAGQVYSAADDPNGASYSPDMAGSRTPDSVTNGLTLADGVRAGGQVAGAAIGGIPGAVVSAVGRGIGGWMDANRYNEILQERGLEPNVDRGRSAVAAATYGIGQQTARDKFEGNLEAARETTRGQAFTNGVGSLPDPFGPDGPKSDPYGGVDPNEGAQTPSGPMADPFGPDGTLADPYGGVDPQSGQTNSETSTSTSTATDPGGGLSGASNGEAGLGGYYSKGGHVKKEHLHGPNPPGPDDGYGGLDDDEFVVKAEAAKYYGPSVMQAINNRQVSRETLKRFFGG